ncbi:uncharacterized protein CC84DRAFT_852697 [Paraphaeosphaeria sporulosa]|uniref:Uncharacterized protein n=1 Tax=Paraphaeosphaeria sporulosa TaxID=1460663 RepID=A0A177C9U2_9PLEO|nr:uncharacterized protein CC84DRAFT_852697 [Paraphaeosphaeria sporulosa]OAG03490.1 hypothetical protein CC84DRAFT_852697 [Paraphaeosphaeria sporulosa]
MVFYSYRCMLGLVSQLTTLFFISQLHSPLRPTRKHWLLLHTIRSSSLHHHLAKAPSSSTMSPREVEHSTPLLKLLQNYNRTRSTRIPGNLPRPAQIPRLCLPPLNPPPFNVSQHLLQGPQLSSSTTHASSKLQTRLHSAPASKPTPRKRTPVQIALERAAIQGYHLGTPDKRIAVLEREVRCLREAMKRPKQSVGVWGKKREKASVGKRGHVRAWRDR